MPQTAVRPCLRLHSLAAWLAELTRCTYSWPREQNQHWLTLGGLRSSDSRVGFVTAMVQLIVATPHFGYTPEHDR
ncbi:uncharacterized protein BDV17DRAFT_144117 [Aspergillus undulatus]|uniref:uncharacterized protein n=1 Tax=Aspergillus undulatus TaxID=1810928 RepID=UPI003CCCC020